MRAKKTLTLTLALTLTLTQREKKEPPRRPFVYVVLWSEPAKAEPEFVWDKSSEERCLDRRDRRRKKAGSGRSAGVDERSGLHFLISAGGYVI